MSQSPDSTGCETEQPVRARILDAAEELFAEKGYSATTVRDIASTAGCNLASVNYYFGGKNGLYLEVWSRQMQEMLQARVESVDAIMTRYEGKPPLDDLLRAFSHSFLGPWTDETKARRLVLLTVREMIDPRLPAGIFTEKVIAPTMKTMAEAIAGACPGLDISKIPLIIFSIAGQLVHMIKIKGIFDHSHSDQMISLDIDETIEHVVKFSAGGIRTYMSERD